MHALDSTLENRSRGRAERALGRCRSVLMVGTDPASLGGIRAVVQSYREGGLFERFPVTYVATHRDGNTWAKLTRALGGWARAARCLVRLDAPLVHVHTASRASFWRKSVVCRMARLAGRPYLLHLHGGAFAHFYHEECGALGRRMIRSVLAHAALVLTVSEQWRTVLERICPEAHIEVLPNAVSLPPRARLHARAAKAREPSRRILFLGQLHAEKGVLDLVRALAAIADRFPHTALLCAGSGAASKVEALARELGVAPSVHCPGWLEQDAKGRALAAADLFVLPSYTEGLPMALLEAMSWGLPVIASPVGGIPQVIRHEENGLLVPAGDVAGLSRALARLLSDCELAARLGGAARATIESQFALDAALAHLGKIYARFGVAPRLLAAA
ncbi:MAG: glycosyltransferase family 4 protein [Steroidobacteraceae bacterium]